MNLPIFATWAAGVLNGYQHKEGGIPTSNKYGILSISSALLIVTKIPEPLPKPGVLIGGLVLGVPFAIGSSFCLGHLLGKSVYHSDN